MFIPKSTGIYLIATLLASLVKTNIATGECEVDCDSDAGCNPGLLCADDHSVELRNAGYDPKKAYCTGPNLGKPNADVCYDPAKVVAPGPGAPPEPRGDKKACDWDCDFDSQCTPGLLCADEHTAELVAKGFDPRTANCDVDIASFFEVCFDSSILNTGGAGGGMYL